MGADAVHAALGTGRVRRLLRVKARQLTRRTDFSRTDRQDIEQALATHVLAKAHLFDPGRASVHTFIERVVDSAVAMILRRRGRLKRAAGLSAESLYEPADAGRENGMLLGELLLDGEDGRRPGSRGLPDQADRGRALDVARVLASLPPDLRDIARRRASATVAEIARDLDTSRRQVRKALDAIRSRFEVAGFGRQS